MSEGPLTFEELRAEIQESIAINEEHGSDAADLYASAMSHALVLLDRYEPEGWISVEDRLPEEGQEVDVWGLTKGSAYPVTFTDNKWTEEGGDTEGHQRITHWRPRSRGPKEKP